MCVSLEFVKSPPLAPQRRRRRRRQPPRPITLAPHKQNAISTYRTKRATLKDRTRHERSRMSSIKPTLNVPNHSRRRISRKREELIPKPASELKRMRDLGWMKSWSVSSLSLDDKRATATISLRISLGSCESGGSVFHPSVHNHRVRTFGINGTAL